ncbi:secreted RxLR effector protein 161-like [Bidens hawaiensis]|uniref:secreted RxLR effector protein 161-like n=1 Tax=Bidens hawaiensis TaxID=980011 RepID=UPI0040495793
MQSPKESHMKAVKFLLRYVKGTLHYGIKYGRFAGGGLVGFSDSNHLTDSDDGKSTSSNVFYYNDCLVSWHSQKQQTVALSSCEAKFMAATSAACEALWLQGLIQEITGNKQEAVGQIRVDFISGNLQRADILTKALPRLKFAELRCMLGVEVADWLE